MSVSELMIDHRITRKTKFPPSRGRGLGEQARAMTRLPRKESVLFNFQCRQSNTTVVLTALGSTCIFF